MRIKKFIILIFFFLFSVYGCHKEKPMEYYYQCKNQSWQRFNKITFNIPINAGGTTYDIYLYANFTKAYSYESLDLNMIMNTPSGEERIMEYNMKITTRGENVIEIKKGLYFSKKGTLSLELENLMPVLKITGISGLGIRLVNSGK